MLEKVKLGMSAITNNIYAYIPEKNNPENMLHKKDVTEDFRAIGIKQIAELEKENKIMKEYIQIISGEGFQSLNFNTKERLLAMLDEHKTDADKVLAKLINK